MGTDKIHRHFALLAEIEELGNPFIFRRRRAAHLELIVHLLYRLHAEAVELEVVSLRASPERRQIRFVPHLEKPGTDFVDSVSLDPVGYEPGDKLRPLRIVFGWRHIRAVMENCFATGRQRRGHEAQLDKRLHPDRQQEIANLVRVEEREKQVILLVHESSHVVAQDVVETHMAKTELLMALC